MAKKPILTDDELDGGLPSAGAATPPPLPRSAGATRPLDADGATPPPPPPPASSVTRPLDLPDEPEAAPADDMPGRDAKGHERPKTRIHGYGGEDRAKKDEMMAKAGAVFEPFVGWLVITGGPGRGGSVGLMAGMNSVGRGEENAAQIDFGDDTISREPHAFVTYDDEARTFHLSHGGKTNIVRLNDKPVLTSETLSHGDTIRIGATSLRLVALCGPDFDWSDT